MNDPTAPFWVLACLAVAGVVGWAMRIWLKSLIEQGIKQTFERDLETLKSDLRSREAAVAGLQNAILSGRAGRTAIVERRQIEGVEAVWEEMVRLRSASMAVQSIKLLKIEEISKRVHEPNMREFLIAMKGGFELAQINETKVGVHEPFVSPVLWSRFSAYKAILLHAVATLEMLANGVGDVSNYINSKHIIDLAKETIPTCASYLDRVGTVGAYYMLEQVSALVLASVRDEIAGVEADAQAVAQATRVSALAKQSEAQGSSLATPL